MGLNAWITGLATSRIHVLVVEVPGAPLVRMRLEAAITARGWVLAQTPADADALLICGEAQPPFPELIEDLWNQIPGPRCRVSVTVAEAIPAALDSIPALLGDRQTQLADANDRPKPTGSGTADDETKGSQEAGTCSGNGDHQHHGQPESQGDGTEHQEPAEPAPAQHQGGHEHNGMEHATQDDDPGHGEADMDEMDMGDMDMDMSGPAGIPLASGDESDRDGLEMDITHLSLGPVLPYWPAGLVVRCTLHGDAVAEASIEILPAGPAVTGSSAVPPAPRAVELCDAAARLLAVAGWGPLATKVRRLRDDLLGGLRPLDAVIAGLERTASRVARSRTLRWSLRGIPAVCGIDAHARLVGWLHAAGALLAQEPVESDEADPGFTLDGIRDALTGQELSTARLVIACIDPSRVGQLIEVGRG